MRPPRVAFFTDSFHEVNGVALTSRQFLAFARRRGLPMLAVVGRHGAEQSGSPDILELPIAEPSLRLDADLRFDLFFTRHQGRVREALDEFKPDIVHVTGPGHLGFLGALAARRLRIPVVASWHTNVHEFGARRLRKMMDFLPESWNGALSRRVEDLILAASLRFYELARLTFAPNPELVQLLRKRTGRECRLMERGIDTHLFSPERRRRADGTFVVGYVGRISPEKNVRLLARVEQGLLEAGPGAYRFLVVGQGSEREWLERNLHRAEFPGVLKGAELAEAYAAMDVFAFPSETDTYGNVVLEAFSSGVPTVVMAKGGPKYLVRSGENGLAAESAEEFVRAVATLYQDRELRLRLRTGALESAAGRTWDAVFESVYQAYAEHVFGSAAASAQILPGVASTVR